MLDSSAARKMKQSSTLRDRKARCFWRRIPVTATRVQCDDLRRTLAVAPVCVRIAAVVWARYKDRRLVSTRKRLYQDLLAQTVSVVLHEQYGSWFFGRRSAICSNPPRCWRIESTAPLHWLEVTYTLLEDVQCFAHSFETVLCSVHRHKCAPGTKRVTLSLHHLCTFPAVTERGKTPSWCYEGLRAEWMVHTTTLEKLPSLGWCLEKAAR